MALDYILFASLVFVWPGLPLLFFDGTFGTNWDRLHFQPTVRRAGTAGSAAVYDRHLPSQTLVPTILHGKRHPRRTVLSLPNRRGSRRISLTDVAGMRDRPSGAGINPPLASRQAPDPPVCGGRGRPDTPLPRHIQGARGPFARRRGARPRVLDESVTRDNQGFFESSIRTGTPWALSRRPNSLIASNPLSRESLAPSPSVPHPPPPPVPISPFRHH